MLQESWIASGNIGQKRVKDTYNMEIFPFTKCVFHVFKIINTAWKVFKYGVFPVWYIPSFELNTEKYECGKIRTRKNSRFGQNSHNAMVSNHTNHRICYFDILAEKILAAGFLSMFVLLVDIKFVWLFGQGWRTKSGPFLNNLSQPKKGWDRLFKNGPSNSKKKMRFNNLNRRYNFKDLTLS